MLKYFFGQNRKKNAQKKPKTWLGTFWVEFSFERPGLCKPIDTSWFPWVFWTVWVPWWWHLERMKKLLMPTMTQERRHSRHRKHCWRWDKTGDQCRTQRHLVRFLFLSSAWPSFKFKVIPALCFKSDKKQSPMSKNTPVPDIGPQWLGCSRFRWKCLGRIDETFCNLLATLRRISKFLPALVLICNECCLNVATCPTSSSDTGRLFPLLPSRISTGKVRKENSEIFRSKILNSEKTFSIGLPFGTTSIHSTLWCKPCWGEPPVSHSWSTRDKLLLLSTQSIQIPLWKPNRFLNFVLSVPVG